MKNYASFLFFPVLITGLISFSSVRGYDASNKYVPNAHGLLKRAEFYNNTQAVQYIDINDIYLVTIAKESEQLRNLLKDYPTNQPLYLVYELAIVGKPSSGEFPQKRYYFGACQKNTDGSLTFPSKVTFDEITTMMCLNRNLHSSTHPYVTGTGSVVASGQDEFTLKIYCYDQPTDFKYDVAFDENGFATASKTVHLEYKPEKSSWLTWKKSLFGLLLGGFAYYIYSQWTPEITTIVEQVEADSVDPVMLAVE